MLEDPKNGFMTREIPNTWFELLELIQLNAEEQRLKRTTREQVIEWARELGLGRTSGFGVESEADGFLQLMHAYGLGVWYGGAAPALRSVVVLDPQWIVDAIAIIIRDFELHSLPRPIATSTRAPPCQQEPSS